MEKVKSLINKIPKEIKDGFIKGVKVSGYIGVSVGLGVLFSEEFKGVLSEYGWYAMYGGVINVALSVLTKILKEKYPDLIIFRLV